MKYSVKKFTALLLALIMVLSLAPLDAIASVFSTYEANVVIDTSESAHLQEDFFTQSVSTPKDNKAGTVLVGTLREDSLLNGSTVEFSEVPAQTRLMKAVAPVSNGRTIARYNITVKNPDDSVWQPDQESGETVDVRVTLNNPVPLIPGDKLSLIHEPDGRDVGATFYKNTNNEMTGFTFEATGFSVYAVVATGEDARLKVKFNSNNTEIASMLVKQADTENANLYNTILYDPGVGTLPEGVIFQGWTDQTTYDLETVQKLSIEDVRNAVAQKLEAGITDLDEVTYYAILAKQYRVDYLDENDVSVGGDVFTYRYTGENENPEVTYTVNMAYTPVDNEHAFMGWTVKEGSSHIAGYTEGRIYENETDITISGDVVFSVNAPAGHWLVFNENGHGATFSAAQFVKSGEVTQRPRPDSEMIRRGYTFGGWYLGAPGQEGNDPTGAAFEFGNELEDNTTVYAKWIPNTNAAYTVIFWTQDLARTNYDVAGSVVVENATVGQNIPYTFVDNQDEDYVTGYNGYGHYTGFCLRSDCQNLQVKIRPEGDSVLNLYYDRIEYNFKFYLYRDANNGNYDYANNSGSGSDLNSLVTWHSNQNQHPSMTGVDIQNETVNNRKYYYFVMQAYYGEDISSKWPKYNEITGANNREAVSFVMMVGTKLKPTATDQGSGTVKGVITVLNENILGNTKDKDGNYVFIRFPNTYYNWRYHIWLETVAGEDYTGKNLYTYNGKTYYEETIQIVRSSNTTDANQNEPKYTGFDYITRMGQNNQGVWGGGHWTTTESGGTLYHLNYIYNRQKFKITYFDGNYVDGNDNRIQNRSSQKLHESDLIGQGAKINQDDIYQPTLPEGEKGYVFEGWYTDEGCTTPYVFTTMPVDGITVYAKWRQIQYRVFLHPNAGTDPTLDWGSNSQQMNFRVSYNGTVSAPTGLRNGYEFGGWYTNPEYNGVYNAGNYRLNEQTVSTSYDKTTHMTDPMDKWGNGATRNDDVNRFWITKEFNLYAKWSTVLNGADGIGIIYDLNGGTGTATDTNLYKDQAQAIAQPAVKASDPDEKVFSHWVMQKWNKSTSAYEDIPGSKVYPGQPFTVLAENAKIESVTDDNGNPVYVTNLNGDYLDENGDVIDQTKPDWQGKLVQKQTYTIQLRAEYKPLEDPPTTHIWWFRNDGSNAFRTDDDILVNEAVNINPAIMRDGYEFIGWAKVAQNGDTAPTTVSATPYLYYANGTFHVGSEGGTVVTQVAADERTPYENMYAVWVPKLQVRITGNTDTKTYNGNEQSVTGYTVEYKVGSDDWTTTAPDGVSVTLKTAGTDVAKGTNVNTDPGYPMGLTKDSFTVDPGTNIFDPTTDFTVTDGWLKIEPKKVTITANSADKTYDGTALTDSGYTTTPLETGDTHTFTVVMTADSTITNVGTQPNVIATVDGTAVTTGTEIAIGNYLVTTVNGLLEITPVTDKVTVTITENSDEVTYDGQPHTITGYKSMVSDNELYDVSTSVAETSTEAWTVTKTDAGTYDMGIAAADFANTNTNFTNVEFKIVDGQLKINPITDKVTVTITENSDEVTYDGQPHTITGYKSMVSDNELYDVTTSVTETSTEAWTVTKTDAGTYDMGIAAADFANTNTNFTNVEFKIVDGQLKINKRPVTLTSGDAKRSYNGEALTNDDVTGKNANGLTVETGWVEGEGATYSFTGSQTLVGESANAFTVTLKENTKADNYDITKTEGKLIVDDENVPDDLVVKKTADDTVYKLGEEVTFDIWVKNIYDDIVTIKLIEIEGVTLAKDTFEGVEPGAEITTTATYTITEADILAGSFTNTVKAKVVEKEWSAKASVKVEDPNGHLTVTKETTSETPEGGYKLGETVSYKITVLNDGNLTITDIKVLDERTGDEWPVASLAPGESAEFTASTTVTEDDILSGHIINEATATGKSPDPDKPDVPVTPDETDDDPEDPNGHLTVTKETTSETPEGGYKLGETVSYKITVLNDGNLTITDIKVLDERTGDEWPVASLAPGESAEFTASTTVTEGDILSGHIINEATATGKSPDPDKPDVPVTPDETDDDPEDPNGHLTVTKETTSKTPEGGYKLGETVSYKITVLNDGNLTITDIKVLDERTGDEWPVASLAPGESKEFTASTTVTEGDILSGHIINEATATGKSPDPDKPDVPVTPDETDDDPEDPNGHLTVTKETTSETPEGGYKLGDTVNYKITVLNDGNLTITDIKVLDERTGDEWPVASLAPGESKEFTASTTVTEGDILDGHIINEATATGKSPDPDKPDVPVTPDETDDDPEDPNGHITIVKEATSTPEDEKGYAEGETITYKITATNDGNLTITDITVTDDLTGDKWPVESLKPGESKEFTAEYTVTAKDAAAGEVLNVATATGKSPDPEKPDVPVTPGEDPEPTVETKFTLIIRYWIGSTEGELINTVTRVEKAGTEYDVVTPPMEGYTADIAEIKGVLEKDTEYDVVYTPEDYTLTILYRFQDGTEAAETYTEVLHFGDEYSVESPVIQTYFANKQKVEGVMPARDVTVTVIYAKYPVIITIDDFETPLGIGLGSINVGETIE